MIGISRQAHHKNVQARARMRVCEQEVLGQARTLRIEHPQMGCRKLYGEIRPAYMGRDKTEQLLLESGFRLSKKRSYHRTTYAGKRWYENRVVDLMINNINQLWVSDITYIPNGYKKYYYLTLVLDVYSRKIKGWSLSCDMTAENTVVQAYTRAINQVSGQQRVGLIFHSDRGSQYGSLVLERLHMENNTIPSMGGKAWENPHAESLNGILKGEYFLDQLPQIEYKKAKRVVQRVIEKYNISRPHGSIHNRKPQEYENSLYELKPEQRTTMTINY